MSLSSRCVVVVLAPDRVGILRDVTGIVFEQGGNIGGIRQSIVDGFFNLVFTAELPTTADPEMLRAALAHRLGTLALVGVRAFVAPPQPALTAGSHFVATTRGPDAPGTIHAISQFFVERNINIEDWMVENELADVVYVAQVVLPDGTDFHRVQTDFRAHMATRGLVATICHENIFRATGEIGPIKSLTLGN
jgi:glycine cleavage system transcriptional repressor